LVLWQHFRGNLDNWDPALQRVGTIEMPVFVPTATATP
jgi:hypothetical protein